MGRIRTIKPEFPQSESMGRVSRDARLLFVQLWTICDDAGRTRGTPRMLAGLLFPYDEDAPELIEAWLDELEREGCIRRYEAQGHRYLQIVNWQRHQRIDRPSASRIPGPEDRGDDANPREASSRIREGNPDQGPKVRRRRAASRPIWLRWCSGPGSTGWCARPASPSEAAAACSASGAATSATRR